MVWMRIPSNAKPIVNSDAYSLQLAGNGANHVREWWSSGVFHQWATWPAGSTAYLYLTRASVTVTQLTATYQVGGNINAYIGIYDVSGSQATWVRNGGIYLPYVPQYRAEAQFLNATFAYRVPVPASRAWTHKRPLRITCPMPSTGGPFQLGARWSIDHATGAGVAHIEHAWEGAIAGE
jgi:hypothetical protein